MERSSSVGRTIVSACLEDDTSHLLRALRLYLARAGLADGPNAESAALELLDDVAVVALQHAHHFDASREPIPWLLGIALNLIKRMQTERGRRLRREVLVSDLRPREGDEPGEEELFDLLASADTGEAPDDGIDALLALVAEPDRQILRLAFASECSGDEIAQALGIAPGAARVRLHRALVRLRAAYASTQRDVMA